MKSLAPDRRAIILEESARLFAETGFTATTVREIADRCGLASGSIFHHYSTKRQLLVDVIAEGTLRAHALAAKELDGVADPMARLRTLVVCQLQTLNGESKPFSVVANNEFQFLTADERAQVVSKRDAYEQVWNDVLRDAADAGLVSADPLLRLFLLGALNATHTWFDPMASVSLDELADRFVGFIIRSGGPDDSRVATRRTSAGHVRAATFASVDPSEE